MPMRTLRWPGKQYRTTEQTISALAWATNRRGGRPWKGNDVVGQIVGYLDKHDIEVPVGKNRKVSATIRYVIDKLAIENLATVSRNANGDITEFAFKPDVDISGFQPTRLVSTGAATNTNVGANSPASNGTAPQVRSTSAAAAAVRPQALPLPPLPHQRYLVDEVNSLLDWYSENHPDSYAVWADSLVTMLRDLKNSQGQGLV